jgi:CTP-dependent riboflavin kinase
MQLSTLLGRMVKSGEVTLSTNDVETLQIQAQNSQIDLNIKDKELIKQIMRSGTGSASLTKKLDMIKYMAKELKDEGLTVTVTYDGTTVITIGSKAKPTLSKIITRTDSIEINSIRKLMQLGL